MLNLDLQAETVNRIYCETTLINIIQKLKIFPNGLAGSQSSEIFPNRSISNWNDEMNASRSVCFHFAMSDGTPELTT